MNSVTHVSFFSVSVIMAVGNFGYSTVVVPGLFWEKFGAVWTSVLGLILGTASNFGVAFGVRFSEWFADNYRAILLCTLLLGKQLQQLQRRKNVKKICQRNTCET